MKSTNSWCNPQIYEDFYCEIHRFCWQSSDLDVDLSKSSGRSQDYFIYFVWMSVWQWIEVAFYTISPLTDWDLQMVFSWTQIWTQIESGCGSVCVRLNSLISTLFIQSHHEILMFGCNPQILVKFLGKSSDCTDFINPWIYLIDLRIFNFLIFQFIYIHS